MGLSDYPGKLWYSSDPMFRVKLGFGKTGNSKECVRFLFGLNLFKKNYFPIYWLRLLPGKGILTIRFDCGSDRWVEMRDTYQIFQTGELHGFP